MNKEMNYRNTWSKKAREVLLGKKIVYVGYLTDADMDNLGWSSSTIIMKLDDGTLLYPSMDDEGNDAGAIHYINDTENAGILPVI